MVLHRLDQPCGQSVQSAASWSPKTLLTEDPLSTHSPPPRRFRCEDDGMEASTPSSLCRCCPNSANPPEPVAGHHFPSTNRGGSRWFRTIAPRLIKTVLSSTELLAP